MPYYIKTIWGPDGDNYANDGIVNFPIWSEKISRRFKLSDGFLIYETGRKENNRRGHKTVFAIGKISPNQDNLPPNNRRWGWAVRVDIIKRVNCENGIPIKRLRELGIKQFQISGGLIPISKEQFKAIADELTVL